MKITLKTAFEELLKSNNLVSRKPIYEKYDKNVQGNTAWERGDVAASITTCFRDFPELTDKNAQKGVVIATGGNPNIAKISVEKAAEMAIQEALLKLTCVGGVPLAATDCLNFGNPEKPDQMGQLVGGIKGVKTACETLEIPIVSGNVSLYNESNGKSIPPSALISIFGRVDEVSKVKKQAFQNIGDLIYYIGTRSNNFGGSEFFRVFNFEDSRIPEINYEKFQNLIKNLKELVVDNSVLSVAPILRGGIAITTLKSCFINNLGANLKISRDLLSTLFSEDFGVLVSVLDETKIKNIFKEDAIKLGEVTENFNLTIDFNNEEVLKQDLKNWQENWENELRNIF
jgi:phosphoribosylformylglycinamidine synthase